MSLLSPNRSGATRLALGIAVVLGVAGFCLRASFTEEPEPAREASPTSAPEPALGAVVTREEPPTTSAVLMGHAPAGAAPRPATPDPEPAANDDRGHPHPITPAHGRIFRENNFVGGLNGAMDVKDAAGMRRLLARYRAEYPEDSLALQAGYELIADCLEHPGAESEAAARRYYETETASALRRYVRRHCLTPEQAP